MNLPEVDVHGFDEKPATGEFSLDPADAMAFSKVMRLLSTGGLPLSRIQELSAALKAYGKKAAPAQDDDAYDETFSMADEVKEVMVAVRMLRKSIMAPGGKTLREGITVSEAKDVISMSNTMINTLMKSHEKIMNMERYRAVEQATVDVLRELDGDLKLIADLEKFHEEGKKGDGPLVESFITALELRLEG